MSPTLIAAAISAAIAATLAWGAAWHIQAGRIASMQIEAQNERITIQRAARANAERVTGQISAAQGEAQRRLAAADRDGRAAAGDLERLRDTSAAAVRAAADTPATCDGITAAYRDALSEGSSFIQALAADADRCSIERQTLIDAWPQWDGLLEQRD